MERFDTAIVGFITPSAQMAFDVFHFSVIILINCEMFLVCYSSFERLFVSKFLMSFGNHPNNACPDYPNPLKMTDYTDYCDPSCSQFKEGREGDPAVGCLFV